MPPVFERLMVDPLVAPDGLSFVGWVRNANASFSVLNGIVTSAPVSSPSVTTVTFPPGYCFWSFALAEAISDGLKPDPVEPLHACISDLGRRNCMPALREPSGADGADGYAPAPAASRAATTADRSRTPRGGLG